MIQQRALRAEQTATALISRAEHRARFTASGIAVTLQALTAPGLYTAQSEAGRSPADYEHWLTAVLTASLLR